MTIAGEHGGLVSEQLLLGQPPSPDMVQAASQLHKQALVPSYEGRHVVLNRRYAREHSKQLLFIMLPNSSVSHTLLVRGMPKHHIISESLHWLLLHSAQAWLSSLVGYYCRRHDTQMVTICTLKGELLVSDSEMRTTLDLNLGKQVSQRLLVHTQYSYQNIYRIKPFHEDNWVVLCAYPCIPTETLSVRDNQLLDALSQGLSNKHIALAMNCSEKTIRNRLTTLYKKLGVTNRNEAISQLHDATIGEEQ